MRARRDWRDPWRGVMFALCSLSERTAQGPPPGLEALTVARRLRLMMTLAPSNWLPLMVVIAPVIERSPAVLSERADAPLMSIDEVASRLMMLASSLRPLGSNAIDPKVGFEIERR